MQPCSAMGTAVAPTCLSRTTWGWKIIFILAIKGKRCHNSTGCSVAHLGPSAPEAFSTWGLRHLGHLGHHGPSAASGLSQCACDGCLALARCPFTTAYLNGTPMTRPKSMEDGMPGRVYDVRDARVCVRGGGGTHIRHVILNVRHGKEWPIALFKYYLLLLHPPYLHS